MTKRNVDELKSYYYSANLDNSNSNNASFDGPSKYFSLEALKACEKHFLGHRHLEMIYAVLPAWEDLNDNPIKHHNRKAGRGGYIDHFSYFRVTVLFDNNHIKRLMIIHPNKVLTEDDQWPNYKY